jgi:hypothetical protein
VADPLKFVLISDLNKAATKLAHPDIIHGNREKWRVPQRFAGGAKRA